MDLTKIMSTLPFLAPFAAIFMFWGSIQAFLHKIFNLFIIEVDLKDAASESMCHFLLKNAKKINFGFSTYSGRREYLKPLKKNGVYAIKQTNGQSCFFWYKKSIIYMNPKTGRDNKTDSYHENRIKIFFMRGTLNADKLVEEAVDAYNDLYKKYSARFRVNIITGLGNKSIISDEKSAYPEIASSSTQDEIYCNEIIKYKINDIGYGSKDKKDIPYVFNKASNIILNDVKKWKESELWYREKGILWNRGSLLYSMPGAGKSSAIRAVAQTLDLPIYIYDLASLSNREFVQEWGKMLGSIPCVAVFEDIDAVFDGRKNMIGENGGGLSFDCLLNVIGGALPAEGVYTFITTNHIEKLDPALGIPDKNGNSSRNGRLDNMIEMGFLTKDCKTKIANRIFHGTNIDKDSFINITENVTAARFIELCGQAALNEYWGKTS